MMTDRHHASNGDDEDAQMVNLDSREYSQLEGAETYLVELVTPFVVEADDHSIPWW